MSRMFQSALWIGGRDQEDKGQEVDLLKSMTGAGLERSSAPNIFGEAAPKLEYGQDDLRSVSRRPLTKLRLLSDKLATRDHQGLHQQPA